MPAAALAVATTAGSLVATSGPASAANTPTPFPDAVKVSPTSGWVPDYGLPTAANKYHSDGVHALAQDAKWIYLGGNFSYLQNPATKARVNATRLVRISIATGAPDPTWVPTVDDDIRAMVLDPSTSTLYIGGDFLTVDGVSRTRIAAVSTADSGSLKDWYPGAVDNEVKTLIQLDPTTLMAGGAFRHIGKVSRAHLAKISTSGTIDPVFKPAINGAVYTISHPSGASFVYVGGLFTTLGGVPHSYLGALDTTTASPSGWTPPSPCSPITPPTTKTCPVFAFVPTATAIYTSAGGPGGRVTAYNPSTGAIMWQVTGDGDDQALAMIGTELFVGGHFGPRFGNNGPRESLAAIDTATGKVTGWDPYAYNVFPGTWALMVLPDGSLVVGGDQANIGGSIAGGSTGTSMSRFAIFPPAVVSSSTPIP